ncbi:MAG: hypothetical protein JWR61_5197 [Ferruginibacter sp.]|uniref:hypothetical protein n=1 Tax=Ferruginibacter sp. TaxID=1940288 RepID=UPI002657E673|nr:hypothetical protein [Ferruginibacter sp.]MDB5280242.1 hypothetical protein [Ferruginibacter sp.]
MYPELLKKIIIYLFFTTGFAKVNGQNNRVRFYCSSDNSDSILCRIVITEKNGHKVRVNDYVYSYPLNVSSCDEVECYPDEPGVFYEARKTCAQINNIILIDVRSIDIYKAYKKLTAKVQNTQHEVSVLQNGKKLGQNAGTIEKSVSF